jgi:hypothetical protein
MDIEDWSHHLVANDFINQVSHPFLIGNQLLKIPIIELHKDVQLLPVRGALFVDINYLDDKVALDSPTDLLLPALVSFIY